MALGGGTFITQNKVLPGSYINFISVAKASALLSDRGIATMPLQLDWGPEGEVFEVTSGDFFDNSTKIFGYDFKHEKLKGLRDLFLNINTLYAYRLNGGNKASNTYGVAKYSGTRGNDLKVIIQTNVDDETKFDVSLLLENKKVGFQTVGASSELTDNDFIVWDKTATLEVTAGIALTGGSNGEVTAENHQTYLDKIESYSFNTMGIVTTDDTIKALYVNFVKRMRDEVGAKFQLVLYNKSADSEAVINVKNKCVDGAVTNEGVTTYPNESALVYWVTGIEAGCPVNKSCLNCKYDGEFTVNCDYTQNQLVKVIGDGEFTLHKVGGNIRVLSDINSLITVTDTKGEIFKDNQTVRVVDQIANDIAVLFNTKYLGNIPNDSAGRVSLWSDIVKHHQELANLRAIENFSDKDVVVEPGGSKKAVVVSDKVTVIGAMAQLYMTVRVA